MDYILFRDKAVINKHGYAQIVGRIKDMIIRGGENIFPREIEETLHKHPAILLTNVIGVPDERMGEELCTWIRLVDGDVVDEENIREFCKSKVRVTVFIQ